MVTPCKDELTLRAAALQEMRDSLLKTCMSSNAWITGPARHATLHTVIGLGCCLGSTDQPND